MILRPVRAAKLTQHKVPSGGSSNDYAHLQPDLFLTQPVGDECWNVTQSNGTFSNCLKSLQTGNLLRSVATASPPDDRPRVHSKWDNTRYQFIGRSFGVGAATGLTDREISEIQYVQQYTYNETGFSTETTCIYNESSAMQLIYYDTPIEPMFPTMYEACGALPNSNWSQIMQYQNYSRGYCFDGMDFYAQSAFGPRDKIVSTFNRWPINNDTRWTFGMIAGGSYQQLNNTQCETTFEPSLFQVDVSTLNATIKVSRIENIRVEDPDPLMKLRLVASDSYGLSLIMTSLYTSTVGDSFMENIRNLQTNRSVLADTSSSAYTTVVLDAIADSITSIMDDALVALGSAALIFANATQTVAATAKVSAVRIGSKMFIWLVVVINVLGSVGVAVSYFVLCKADIPTFEYGDIGCVAVGLRQGIAVLVEDGMDVGGEQLWDGHHGNRHTGQLAMRLQT